MAQSKTQNETASKASKVLVTFYPQIWHNGYAVTSDDLEKFTVPIEDATDENGDLLPNNTGASDRLRDHENAPDRARNWQGPFYVTVTAVKTVNDLNSDLYDLDTLRTDVETALNNRGIVLSESERCVDTIDELTTFHLRRLGIPIKDYRQNTATS